MRCTGIRSTGSGRLIILERKRSAPGVCGREPDSRPGIPGSGDLTFPLYYGPDKARGKV